jgi:CheY-like chemotaxis protein
MKLVLLSADLMLNSAAFGVARRHGCELKAASDASAALAACSEGDAALLAVDLTMPRLDVGALMTELRGSSAAGVHVLAFGPHVHEMSLASAHEAGCDEVVTRGEFERRLDAALARLAI